MKRVVCLLILTALFFTGCQKKTGTWEILSDALQYACIPYVRVYVKRSRPGNDETLTPAKMKTLYGCVLSDFAADYSIALTVWDDPAEVHIVKAKNETDAVFVEKILNGRLDKLDSSEHDFYRPGSCDTKTGTVERRGLYVFLIYSVNTQETRKAILKYFG